MRRRPPRAFKATLRGHRGQGGDPCAIAKRLVNLGKVSAQHRLGDHFSLAFGAPGPGADQSDAAARRGTNGGAAHRPLMLRCATTCSQLRRR
jgi:hypothetical protein